MPRALWVKAPLALLRHRVGLLAVASAAFLVAIGAAAGPLMNAGAESEALQSKLAQLTPLAAGLVINRPLGRDGAGLAAIAAADRRRRAAAAALGRRLPSVGRAVLTTWTEAELAGPAVPDVTNPVVVVPMARTGAMANVHRLSGSGRGVWLSSAIADRAAGRVTFGSPERGLGKFSLPVGAVYRALTTDLDNPYWFNFTGRIRAVKPDSPAPPSFALVTTAQLYRLARQSFGAELGNDFEFPIVTTSMTPGRAKQIAHAFDDVKRQLAGRTPLAAALGCTDSPRGCSVSSELTDAVRIAAASNSSLRPVVDLLAGFCVLIALGAALIAGVFTGRRRAAEARLSLVGGEPSSLFLARAALEAFLPAVLGAALGFALAVETVRLFTPDGAVDASVVRSALIRSALSVVAAAAVVALGVTLARGRLGPGRGTVRRLVSRAPWELAALAVAAAVWLVVRSGGGLVKDRVAGSHPRLVVLLVPALVAAPLSGLADRAIRSLVLRRVSVASVTAFLALRRVAAARGLVIALTVTVAAGVASLAFAEILQSSLRTSSTEKAFVANGSDVQGLVDATQVLPASFPYPVTKVTEVFAAGLLASGRSFDAIVVDPPSLARVLAPHWSRGVRSAVRSLETSQARLPAIAVGLAPGRQTVTLGTGQTDVDVVASVRAFAGMQPGQALLVFPERAVARPPEALSYVWATGPPAQVAAALARSSLAPSYLTQVAEFSSTPEVANITRTYGFLRIVALAIVLLALVALMLYLNGRGRSQVVTSAFLRRMGFAQSRQAWSVALESSVLVGVATIVGLAAAVITAGAIVGHVDPLSQYSPPPVTEVPWLRVVLSGLGVIVAAGLVGALLTLLVRRSDVGEELRVN